jgi:hypothetical protein
VEFRRQVELLSLNTKEASGAEAGKGKASAIECFTQKRKSDPSPANNEKNSQAHALPEYGRGAGYDSGTRTHDAHSLSR